MKQKVLRLLTVALVATISSGCSNGAVSNEIITISSYKGLEVKQPVEEENVWNALLDNCTVAQYPQKELETLISQLETEYSYAAYYQNKTASDLIEEIHGMTMEEFAKEQLKKTYAIALIAEKEGLNVTLQEYEEELEKLAESAGFSEPQEYESMYGQEEVMANILEERVLKVLVKKLK